MTKELKAQALEYFNAYPEEQVIHFTTDGQVFLQKNYNDAVTHQRQFLEKNPEDKLVSVYRKDVIEKPTQANTSGVPDKTTKKEDVLVWLKANDLEHTYTGRETKDDLLKAVEAVLEGNQVTIPDETWKPADIVSWLKEHNEEANENESMQDLMVRVQLVVESLTDNDND